MVTVVSKKDGKNTCYYKCGPESPDPLGSGACQYHALERSQVEDSDMPFL